MSRLRWYAGTALLAAALIPQAYAQPRIAILDSNNSREFFGRHYPPCTLQSTQDFYGRLEFDRYLFGWTYVLSQAGISYQTITDAQVTEAQLASYGLLILPNTASLSDEQSRVIQRWVLQGGRLLATYGSGYKNIVRDARQIDQLKLQKGGTSGLHNLWHDPLSNLFSAEAIGAGVDFIRITRFAGPTQGLQGQALVGYGSGANLLIQRPEDHQDTYAFLVFANAAYTRLSPAIISTKAAKGTVVYFAFSPEYLVAMEFGQHCVPPQAPWTGRGQAMFPVMLSAVNYLLGQ